MPKVRLGTKREYYHCAMPSPFTRGQVIPVIIALAVAYWSHDRDVLGSNPAAIFFSEPVVQKLLSVRAVKKELLKVEIVQVRQPHLRQHTAKESVLLKIELCKTKTPAQVFYLNFSKPNDGLFRWICLVSPRKGISI